MASIDSVTYINQCVVMPAIHCCRRQEVLGLPQEDAYGAIFTSGSCKIPLKTELIYCGKNGDQVLFITASMHYSAKHLINITMHTMLSFHQHF